MSVERMRILLGLDNINQQSFQTKRQQITPDIRFTCDGMITKWIVGANMAGSSFNPELQVWRNIGNDVYQSTVSESPYDMMDISSVMSQGYHPLVSVEIGKQASSFSFCFLD